MLKPKYHIYEDEFHTVENLANYFTEIHTLSKNRFYVLPGGNSPKSFYKTLSKKIIDWSDSKILLSDERLVDENDKHSNLKMLKETFIENISDCKNRPFIIDLKDQKSYRNKIVDLTILGLGTDGHTASLFPNNKNNLHDNVNPTFITRNGHEDFERITLTYEFLLKSNNIAFLVFGENKKEILNHVIYGEYTPLKFPAQYIFNNYSKPIDIFCDKLALGDSLTGTY